MPSDWHDLLLKAGRDGDTALSSSGSAVGIRAAEPKCVLCLPRSETRAVALICFQAGVAQRGGCRPLGFARSRHASIASPSQDLPRCRPFSSDTALPFCADSTSSSWPKRVLYSFVATLPSLLGCARSRHVSWLAFLRVSEASLFYVIRYICHTSVRTISRRGDTKHA